MGWFNNAVQNRKISSLSRRGQSGENEVPLTKLKLLGNLPQPGIFKQLRQDMLGEHSLVVKRLPLRHREVAAFVHRLAEKIRVYTG